VVLPEPKNPVRMVAGIKAMEILQKERRSKNQNRKEVYPSMKTTISWTLLFQD
jgi:hypothetical protein